MKRVAVIDCGTNTFNLLVADLGENGEWKTVFKMNSPVKLTPGGPSKSIAVNRIARAVDVMRAYYHHTINYEVQETYAFATSAFRSTENGRKLRDLIEERTKINVEIIDGDREAQLIFQGVVYSGLLDSSPALIMDIGGGSTEFIIANNEQQLWKKSFQIGVSRVFNRFNPADPMSAQDRESIAAFLEDECQELFGAMDKYKPVKLIGTAGSFDTMIAMIGGDEVMFSDQAQREISWDDFTALYNRLMQSTLEQRLDMKGLRPYRAPYMPTALLLTKFVVEKGGINRIFQTPYSLKEGVLLNLQKHSGLE